jgi:hypothetical protein
MENSRRNSCVQAVSVRNERGAARIVPIFAILLLIALGALAAPQYQDQNRDRDQYRAQNRDGDRGRGRDGDRDRDRFRDRGNTILILGYERISRDFGGGNGGRPSPDALCDPGFVAVGFHVQTGEFFNQAWLDCAPMRSDGSLGDERRMTSRTGSPGGRPVSDAYCAPGLALRGLRGRSGASIDEAAGECSAVREIGQRFENPRTELTQSVMRPRAGGRPTGTECPAGSVVTGFRSMSGEYMDHLWVVCSELQRSY